MIEETATVVSCVGNQATLVVERKSTCSSCNAKTGCGTAVFAKTVGNKTSQVIVENTLNLHAGDTVVVGLQESALLTGSAMIYLLPLIIMLVSAISGQWLADHYFHVATEYMAVFFAAGGFVLAMFVVRRFSQKIKSDKRYQPVLLRKLIN